MIVFLCLFVMNLVLSLADDVEYLFESGFYDYSYISVFSY